MRSLEVRELDKVSGGNPLILYGVLTAILAGASQIEDFCQGFADGVSDHNEKGK